MRTRSDEIRYPVEALDADADDGIMPDNVDQLRQAVVGHRIVKVDKREVDFQEYGYVTHQEAFVITLDNGQEVRLVNSDDCCAFTELESFLLHPDRVDHMIMGVGTTDAYTRWHIYADWGDVLELTVGWSCGNPFYYGYGFSIDVAAV